MKNVKKEMFEENVPENYTEFEKSVARVMWTSYNYDEFSDEGVRVDAPQHVHATAKSLLEVARKEISKQEYVVCAAIWYDNGLQYKFQTQTYGVPTGFVLCGYRHPHICDVLPTNPYYLEKCFLDEEHNAEQIQKYEELKYKYGWQENGLTRCKTVQGFMTSTGRFVGRKEAWKIAVASGQISENGGYNKELFSEDLY